MKPVVGVTGATGFIGRALFFELKARGYPVIPLVRQADPGLPDARVVGPLGPHTPWGPALKDIECVVHCAARAHVPLRSADQDLQECRTINVEGTRSLAQAAAARSVRRLIYVSSVKVLGERSEPGRPLTAQSRPAPEDIYGQTKWEAEQALAELAGCNGLETVVVRPPLVYGPGVKANFLRLMQAVGKGTPLPLGAIHNKRSLLALDNLIDLLIRCVDAPEAADETLLVSDDQDLSTPELIRALAQAMHRPPRLWPCPPGLLRLAGDLSGRTPQVERLIGNLQLDIRHTKNVLRWAPRCTVQQGLEATTRNFSR